MNQIGSDLLFSVNTVLPVFIIILVGYFLRRKGTIDESFVDVVSKLVFYYALPARLFLDVATSDFRSLVNIRFIGMITGGTVAVFLISWLVNSWIYHDPQKIAAAVHCGFRGNYVYIGLPISQNILQMSFLPTSVLILTFVMPIYNILGVTILSIYSNDMSKVKPGKLLLSILKNPMILAVVFGLIYGLLGIPMPYAARQSLTYMGAIATPMALLMIGARMMGNSIKGEEGVMGMIVLFKLILGPIVMTVIAIAMGMSSEEIVSIFVLFAAPTAMNAFIMAKTMGGDDGLAANAILTTVALSTVVMTAGIYCFRVLHII